MLNHLESLSVITFLNAILQVSRQRMASLYSRLMKSRFFFAYVTLRKRWRLTNMSNTNPVVVNGQPLEGEDASLVLTEGDQPLRAPLFQS